MELLTSSMNYRFMCQRNGRIKKKKKKKKTIERKKRRKTEKEKNQGIISMIFICKLIELFFHMSPMEKSFIINLSENIL